MTPARCDDDRPCHAGIDALVHGAILREFSRDYPPARVGERNGPRALPVRRAAFGSACRQQVGRQLLMQPIGCNDRSGGSAMTMQRDRQARALAASALTSLRRSACRAASAQPIELKLAYFVGDQHAMSHWLIKWADKLEKDSGGRIAVKRFPGSQMGPMQQHYDFARTGQADVVLVPAWRDARALPADRDRRSCPISSAAPRSAPRCSTIPSCARNISMPSTRA